MRAPPQAQQLRQNASPPAAPALARTEPASQPARVSPAASCAPPRAAAGEDAPPTKRVRVGAAPTSCVVTTAQGFMHGEPAAAPSRIANITLLVQPCGLGLLTIGSGGVGMQASPDRLGAPLPGGVQAAAEQGRQGALRFARDQPSPGFDSPFLAQCSAPFADGPLQAPACLVPAKRKWEGRILTRVRSCPDAPRSPQESLPPASASAPPQLRAAPSVVQRLADLVAMPPPPARPPRCPPRIAGGAVAAGAGSQARSDGGRHQGAAGVPAGVAADVEMLEGDGGGAPGEGAQQAMAAEAAAVQNLLLLRAGECGAYARTIGSHAAAGSSAAERPSELEACAALNRWAGKLPDGLSVWSGKQHCCMRGARRASIEDAVMTMYKRIGFPLLSAGRRVHC